MAFPGIPAGETFEAAFPLRQAGTYWYHSHSGFQEQIGQTGPLVVHPAGGERHPAEREYVLVLNDWSFGEIGLATMFFPDKDVGQRLSPCNTRAPSQTAGACEPLSGQSACPEQTRQCSFRHRPCLIDIADSRVSANTDPGCDPRPATHNDDTEPPRRRLRFTSGASDHVMAFQLARRDYRPADFDRIRRAAVRVVADAT
nr:multicopper oxidase domain-containing protein [Salinisphaera sp. Q1T1-3]